MLRPSALSCERISRPALIMHVAQQCCRYIAYKGWQTAFTCVLLALHADPNILFQTASAAVVAMRLPMHACGTNVSCLTTRSCAKTRERQRYDSLMCTGILRLMQGADRSLLCAQNRAAVPCLALPASLNAEPRGTKHHSQSASNDDRFRLRAIMQSAANSLCGRPGLPYNVHSWCKVSGDRTGS